MASFDRICIWHVLALAGSASVVHVPHGLFGKRGGLKGPCWKEGAPHVRGEEGHGGGIGRGAARELWAAYGAARRGCARAAGPWP